MNLMHGDCLELMASIPDGSVDMVLTDPPYGTMKGLTAQTGMDGMHDWDAALKPSDFLEHCNRALRPNGALVLFSQEPYTSRLITEAHGSIPFSYRMTWVKDHFANCLSAKKAPVSYTEDVCIFFKAFDSFLGHPLKPWFDAELEASGFSVKEAVEKWGSSVSHCFTNGRQFTIPSEKRLENMRRDSGRFQIPHSEMKAVSDEFRAKTRERLPKVFNLHDGKKFKSNILTYRKDYTGHHPTQKPVALLEDLLKTYSNAGDTVLDFTMGSGSTGVACANTGRNFIGIEKDEKYFAIAKQRIESAQTQLLTAA